MYNNIHVERVRNILDDILTSTVPGVRSGSLWKSQDVNQSADGEVPSLRLVILPLSHTESHRAFAC
ncbi:hypothetical protein PSI23_14200 [Xenorhabdus sp. XENO-10]|uniref:Uncharacterized protein n=1 Tax=Xenorhabdus yunnanensis TaxID=3025878 RepID=A0ABT5LHJ5_9GAMM|nr:hypothetical protein [Xenorhabdus yunnanensis]MDC9590409.1 hypothetical protein [Xenorhabdus yunnanensis]